MLSEEVNLKKLCSVGFQLYDITEKANCSKRSVVEGLKGRKDEQSEAEDFRAKKSLLLDTLMENKGHCSKPIEYTTLRVDPNVNYGPWVI